MPAHRVYLVRHAKAEPHGGDDDARELTPEGRARFVHLAGALRGRLEVSRVVTSPLTRARQTAELLARATRAPIEQDPRLAPGSSSGRELLDLARESAPGTALVGHNPEIAEAVAEAAGTSLEVKPGAVAALEVDGRRVGLAWLETPARE